MSADLTAFLRARLDDDEQTARAASKYAEARWHLNDLGDTILCFPPEPRVAEAERRHGLPVTSDQWRGITIDHSSLVPHIARHDPARVLADTEAKRQITKIHFRRRSHDWDEPGVIGFECAQCCDRYPCVTLRLLALPYADHPDYRPEWAPRA